MPQCLPYLLPVAALIFASVAGCASSDADGSNGPWSAGSSGSASSNGGEAGSSNAGASGTSAEGGSDGLGGKSGSSGDGGSGDAGAAGSGDAGAAGSGDAGAAGSGGSDEEPAPFQGITAAHNAVRAAVDPAASPPITPLSWTPSLAAAAQAWADKCNWKHSSNPYGENIYASAGAAPNAPKVVSSWASEVKNYNYSTNQCSGVCGHYTQVVWATSTHLGCGYAHCTTNSPFSGSSEWDFWVCNYDPAGNYPERPYCTADQTSGCSK